MTFRQGHRPGPVFKRVLGLMETRQALADVAGINRQAVNDWLHKGFIPAKHVARVSSATGGRVTMQELLLEADAGVARLAAMREAEEKLGVGVGS